MVFPLALLGLAGLAGAGAAGSTALGGWLERRDQEAQAQRVRAAMGAGMVAPQMAEAPREDPSFVGPGAPVQTQPGYFDPYQMAMELARQGDPMGLQMLSQQSAGDEAFQRQIYMEHMRQQGAMDRLRAGQPAPGPSINVAGLGQVPVEPVPVGSKEWMDLERERAGLDRVYEIMNEFRDVLQTSGSESIGATAQKLGALRAELINARALASQAGALQEAEIDFYGSMVPDPTRWTPEFMTQEAGKLEALADWYNSQARGFQNRAQFTGGLSPLRMFPSESLVPSDWSPVDEGDIGPDPRVEREGLQVSVPTLDDLLKRAEAGEYVSPAEWRGQ